MYFYQKNVSLSTVLVLLLSILLAYQNSYSLYDWCFFTAFFVLFFFTIKYHWRFMRLYYYASKFDGPLSLPLIGIAYYFLGSFEDVIGKLLKLANNYSEIFGVWFGTDLYIFNSCPEHLEIILNKCLGKSPIYKILTGSQLSDSMLVSPVNQWKKNRKIINPTFSLKTIKSFQNTFAAKSKVLIDELKDKCQMNLDIFPILSSTNYEMTCETLFDMDRNESRNRVGNPEKVISQLMRVEEIFVQRTLKPWLYPTIFWKLSPLYKEAKILISELRNIAFNMIEIKRSQHNNDEIEKLQFLNLLIKNNDKLTEKELLDEFQLMLLASIETTALTKSFVLLVLAIKPEIQQKVYEELYTIFGDSEREATLDDLNQMDYLERVIKETMRLFPTILGISRFLDSDLKIDSYTFPKGSNIVVPIVHLHRTPKLWKDPLKFDLDRFLPENIKKRHRCAYIPFSVGPRNCPGALYAMISMKTLLSMLLRHYKVVSCNYEKLEDIKMVFKIVTITNVHKGFKVVFEKRA